MATTSLKRTDCAENSRIYESHTQILKPAGVLILIPFKQNFPEVPCLKTMYREYFAYVCRILRRLCVAQEHVEDLAQDVFIIVARKLQNYQHKGAIKGWLYRIAHHEVLHYRRSYARRKHRGVPFTEYGEQTTAQSLWPPEQTVACKQVQGLVKQFLASLDEEKRRVFFLYEIEGLTAPEIAANESINLNTVYSRIRMAKKQWKEFRARVGLV